MSKKFRAVLCALFPVIAAMPSLADDTGFEVIGIGEQSSNESNYAGLSLRVPLFVSAGISDRVAFSGPRLRLDMARSSYSTGYDSVVGIGEATTSRLLLSYGFALSDSAALTITGGLSRRSTQVRPTTKSAPADSDRDGTFVAAEFELVAPGVGDLQLLLEADETAGVFGSLTYLHGMGGLRAGPTFSHYSEDDYELSRAGIVTAVDIADDTELRVSLAKGWSSLSGGSADELSSFQVQLRLAF